jgi:hypothetical protein
MNRLPLSDSIWHRTPPRSSPLPIGWGEGARQGG